MQLLPTDLLNFFGSPEEDVSIAKQKLRVHYRAVRKSVSNEARELLDATLCANASEHYALKNAKTLLFYYPVKGEPNIKPLITWAFLNKKSVAFPISNCNTSTLSFRLVNNISELSCGAYGIPEPSNDAPCVTDFKNAVCIVPGLVFDRNGYRIGYGKGYYDRFISNFDGTAVGLAYDGFCIPSELPHDEYDETVDIIITERGIIVPDAKKR
jgi:5-formyltetrahydrofolate cyclo-ligase